MIATQIFIASVAAFAVALDPMRECGVRFRVANFIEHGPHNAELAVTGTEAELHCAEIALQFGQAPISVIPVSTNLPPPRWSVRCDSAPLPVDAFIWGLGCDGVMCWGLNSCGEQVTLPLDKCLLIVLP